MSIQTVIRRLNGESEEDIKQWRGLYATVYGREFPEDVWKWKYLDNPCSLNDPLIYIAETNNRIVGANSFLPSEITLLRKGQKETSQVCQSNNTMVHPDFRRQGIFVKILKTFMEQYSTGEYKLILGYPNDNSLTGFRHSGFDVVSALFDYTLMVNSERPLRKYLSNKGIPRLVQNPLIPLSKAAFSMVYPNPRNSQYSFKHGGVSEFAEDISGLYDKSEKKDGFYGSRSIEFLTWRYRRPGRQYQVYTLYDGENLVAYVILYTDGDSKSVLVKDIYAELYNPSLLNLILSLTINQIRKENYDSFHMSLPERDWTFGASFSLLHGFLKKPQQEYLVVRGFNGWQDNSEFLADKNNWYLQQVDRSPF